jgi:hypothetical protein
LAAQVNNKTTFLKQNPILMLLIINLIIILYNYTQFPQAKSSMRRYTLPAMANIEIPIGILRRWTINRASCDTKLHTLNQK